MEIDLGHSIKLYLFIYFYINWGSNAWHPQKQGFKNLEYSGEICSNAAEHKCFKLSFTN